MSKEEYDERFAEIITYCMTLCYALEDFADYSPHFLKEVKKSGKLFLEKLLIVRDLYFGVKGNRAKVGMATEEEQTNLFQNMKMIEELTTRQLRLTEEQRTQIKNIINQYEQQI